MLSQCFTFKPSRRAGRNFFPCIYLLNIYFLHACDVIKQFSLLSLFSCLGGERSCSLEKRERLGGGVGNVAEKHYVPDLPAGYI